MIFVRRSRLEEHGTREDRSGVAAERARGRRVARAGRQAQRWPGAAAAGRIPRRRQRSPRSAAPRRSAAGRFVGSWPASRDGRMKKPMLITGFVLAALVLALYGVIVGTGTRPA